MGFPDSYKIPVSDTRAYKQFGNSVVVYVIIHIAKIMQPMLEVEYLEPELPFFDAKTRGYNNEHTITYSKVE